MKLVRDCTLVRQINNASILFKGEVLTVEKLFEIKVPEDSVGFCFSLCEH